MQSLAWTIPLVVMCLLVVWRVWPYFKASLATCSHCRTERDWIVIGIAVAFIGKALDATWWFIPWSLSHVDHPSWAFFNSLGVYFNIIFRQAFITYAAYCHIRAFTAPGRKEELRFINMVLLFSVLIGQLYPLLLEIYARSHFNYLMKNILILAFIPILGACVTYTQPSGAKFTSFGGQVAMVGKDWAFRSNHENSFSDATSVFKHGIWGLGVVAPLGKEAAGVIKTKSNNSLTKAINASDNSVLKHADDNALNALKSNNELKQIELLNQNTDDL